MEVSTICTCGLGSCANISAECWETILDIQNLLDIVTAGPIRAVVEGFLK